mgnify:CR=1 FL=1
MGNPQASPSNQHELNQMTAAIRSDATAYVRSDFRFYDPEVEAIYAANDYGDDIDWAEAEKKLHDRFWRLNNLYKIVDKDSNVVTFKMTDAQERLYRSMHTRNIILKARQHGFTTFVMILMLDVALFNSNIACGVVAHGLEEASDLFRKKILFAYNNLPAELKQQRPVKKQTQLDIEFTNDSSIRVGTSLRSGTYHWVHISEFGKICRKYPARADEVVTGTLETVPSDGVVFIESTAEGQEGYFYDYCEDARELQNEGKKPGRLDYKFHFVPWWKEAGYRLTEEEARAYKVPMRLEEYFWRLEDEYGIELDERQRAWYAAKEAKLGSRIWQEYPSTPEEAFAKPIEGAYYASLMAQARHDGRITRVPHQPSTVVDTWWDIGYGDQTAIWFTQTVGREIHVIDFYANSGEGIAHYARVLQEKSDQHGYQYGRHHGPHDIESHHIGSGKNLKEMALESGLKFDDPVPKLSVEDGIEAVRRILPICWFDAEACADGIRALESYRKEWDENKGCWKDKPLHDWSSDPADAFRYLAVGHPMNMKPKSRWTKTPPKTSARVR